jgi:hypothetical protein
MEHWFPESFLVVWRRRAARSGSKQFVSAKPDQRGLGAVNGDAGK